MKSSVIKWWSGLMPSALFLAAIGCADIRSYCEDLTNCEGGNDDDRKACIAEQKGLRAAADEYGCRDEYDRYIACYVEYGQCLITQYDTERVFTTMDEETGADMCLRFEAEWWSCGAIESRAGW
jgi:hypothetical protein